MVTALGKAGKMVFQAQIRLLLLLSPEMMFYRNIYAGMKAGTGNSRTDRHRTPKFPTGYHFLGKKRIRE